MDLKEIQIIILAAGKGKRMESDKPKALAELQGKPFLKHILETLNKINLPIKPIIVVGHKKEDIFEIFGPEHNYAHQIEQLGTGHAVLSAQENVHPDSKIIFIISTDQPLISKTTILNIIEKHQEEKATLTLGTVLLPDFNEWRSALYSFGRIIRNENGEILKNTEYKDATEEERKITEVNPAIYAFDAEWLWQNLPNLKNENSQSEYYLTDLVKLAQEQEKKIIGVPIENILEAFQPNSKAELEILENLLENN
jgi:bifunctional UDP-N-acetylglucosamine pyrophosphorylase/glucosamine-1-phosphate N-acetyltransferase